MPTRSRLLYTPKQLPRYTSYPTAPHFHTMPEEAYREWLGAIAPQEAVSLYLHVPYCKKLCWFCGCHTRISERYEPLAHYIPILIEEMKLVTEAIGRKQPVSHIHWGGGSPSYLRAQDFSACMEALKHHFHIMPWAQVAVEIDPRNVNEAQIASYAKHGVNRVSLGVQDFDHDVQLAINRVQPFGMVYDLLGLCRNYGISDINLDLIYGLPRQSVISIQKTMEMVLHLRPGRISLFGYAHVPWKKKNITLIEEKDLPDEALRLDLFAAARAMLTEAGYIPIGLDHFVLPDDSMAAAYKQKTLHRNFQGYTTDSAPTLIGLGASAIGNFAEGYAQNNGSIEDYSKAVTEGRLATSRGYRLRGDDALHRAIIEQIMCYLEVNIAEICAAYRKPVGQYMSTLAALHYLEEDGLVSIDGSILRINPEYPQAARMASACFDRFYAEESGRHSQVS